MLGAPRSALRRRIGDFLRTCAASRLLRILRSGAVAGAVAAALRWPSPAAAQGIELADVARGVGGFIVRGEGQPLSGASASVSAAGDVNGDGFADILIAAGLADSPYPSLSGAAYVIFGGPAVGGPRFLRGDFNASGRINITDGIAIFRHLFLGEPAAPPCRESADAQNDGAIDISDGIYVLSWLFTGGPEPAAPGPSVAPCGADPDPPGSPGDLGCVDYAACP